MATVYFFYSREHVQERNKILSSRGKKFQPGIVIVNGKRVNYSQMSANKDAMKRFVDSRIVASGEQSSFTYTKPTEILKGAEL